MREIRFRAWDTYDDKWRYFTIGQAFGTLGESLYSSLCLEGATFYQYTGLKDKNGKEIYEGDLLRCSFLESDDKPSPIVFGRGCFYVGYEPGMVCLTIGECEEDEIEVVGNIYEHSHLLKD